MPQHPGSSGTDLEKLKELIAERLEHDRWNSALSDETLAEKIALALESLLGPSPSSAGTGLPASS